MAKDLALAANGDLFIDDTGDFEIIDAVRQGIQIRLRWIKGEWVFNTAMGTPYFETILVKTPNRALIEKVLRNQIIAVDGVTEVGSISLVKDAKSRTLRASFTATTTETSVYKGYKQDKIEMRGDRAEMSDFPLYLNTVAGGLDCRDQTIGGFSFVVKIYALPVVEIIG